MLVNSKILVSYWSIFLTNYIVNFNHFINPGDDLYFTCCFMQQDNCMSSFPCTDVYFYLLLPEDYFHYFLKYGLQFRDIPSRLDWKKERTHFAQ